MKRIFASQPKHLLPFVALMASLPLLFENALEYSFPMGYAGLFTQMAKQIAAAHFQLPLESPYYGPGGIPFAYPPLGLYLLAAFIKVTGKYFIFLRLAPPILSLLSLLLVFLLALEISDSAPAAAFTTIMAAASPDLYAAHAWAAGVVRAPAFIFTLLAIYFFTRNHSAPSRLKVLLMGAFFGLTILSHLAYALFCLAWFGFFSLANRNLSRTIRDSLCSVSIGLLISLVWVIPIASRHGWGVFANAMNSHGGESIFSIPGNPGDLVHLLWINLTPITSSLSLVVLLLAGVLFFLRQRKYAFLLFFFLITLAFPENGRFVSLLGSLLAGCGLWLGADWLSGVLFNRINFSRSTGAFFLSVPVIASIWWTGFLTLSDYTPRINEWTLGLAENIPTLLAPKERYLALVIQDEAEWMPFLFEREPLVAQWGSEWIGEYDEQIRLMALFRICQRDQNWSCVETVLNGTRESTEAVITYQRDERLNEQIRSTGRWEDIYSNNRYVVWKLVNGPTR
jgi:hypothetical protein